MRSILSTRTAANVLTLLHMSTSTSAVCVMPSILGVSLTLSQTAPSPGA